ncbi:MAG: sigma 54-dependent Fis family transcriptional regulator [Deltaproteobacteria bacterium]|nr:sigma 54-dependent Fis family transcriptional regulator [Deltaproteobacteria bacterium]MDQ3300962.1 sigma 54-interacting transcriptional regulator [Myxococcota bacterium]
MTDLDTPTALPTTGLPSTAPRAIRSVRVEVVTGPDAGACLRGAAERIVIGTHRTADLVLTDRTVSRFHVELEITGDAVHLRDLGSRNGTLLDGVELEAARLRGPTIVSIGQSELRIDLLGDTVTLELAPQERFGALVGASPVMRLAFARLHGAALRDGHVLIEGERGTGKDTAAAALHELGTRKDGPLDVIDCGMPALEVEALLFGRGDFPRSPAFAGSLHHGASVLERCHGGTLILDDVGGLARNTQRVLVRALEERSVRRLHGGDPYPADVRVIALSRRNLRVDVNSDRFAPDLFEVLAATRIRIPPLRERPEDVPLLIARVLGELEATGTAAAAELQTPESLEQLRGAAWPGNVRELRAHVEATVAANGTPAADAHTVPLVDGSLPLREARDRWVRYFERTYVAELLVRTSGNVSAAAALAGVDRVYMHRMVTRAGLREKLSRDRK